MGRIDEYTKIKATNLNAIKNLRHALKQNVDWSSERNNDKGQITAYDRMIWDSDMPVYIHASYGYYGSSSGYAVGDRVLREYLIQAINSYMCKISEKAIELMNTDIELARKAAEAEALAVLNATKV